VGPPGARHFPRCPLRPLRRTDAIDRARHKRDQEWTGSVVVLVPPGSALDRRQEQDVWNGARQPRARILLAIAVRNYATAKRPGKKGPGRGLVRSEPDLRPVVIRMPACLSVWLSPPTPRNMKESDAVRPTCVCAAAAANLYISRGLITGCLARGGTVPCRRRRGPCGCRGAGATCTVQCRGRAGAGSLVVDSFRFI
jgi:hypothetical protein